MEKCTILEMEAITKSYGGVEVLHGVNFDLKSGEVHVLIGENGAGKSTLMKILAGAVPLDSGIIRVADETGELKRVNIKDPVTAQRLGVCMVYQESNLIDNISIAENLYLGNEPLRMGMVDWPTLYQGAVKQLEKVQCHADPKRLVETLSVAEKQTVEIAKAISSNARILVLDEPTSSLSDREVGILFGLIQQAKQQGIGIVYISHRMDEIFAIGDRITVFRDGSLINTVDVAQTTQSELIKMMIGRELERDEVPAHSLPDGTPVALSVRNFHVMGCETPVNFDLLEGEILGVFGLVGAGRTELAEMLFGITRAGNGTLVKNGRKIVNNSPDTAIKNGFALLPEDRKRVGLIGGLSIRENLLLVKLRELKAILWRGKQEREIAADYMKQLSVAARDQDQLVSNLSGGNQQKVVLAKWLSIQPDIMILDEPTRGIDVAVKAEIYQLMQQLAKRKVSILMISSDLPEILKVSNRVMVMHDHRVTLIEKRELLDQKRIMEAAIQ